jgi:hypothetical protein
MDRNDDSQGGRDMSGASDSNGMAADRLRRAVGAATAGSGSRDEVQAAARALVSELRRGNEGPEQMLIQVKALLGEAGLRATYPATDANESHGGHATLYRDIITWSIRCYYDEDKKTSS